MISDITVDGSTFVPLIAAQLTSAYFQALSLRDDPEEAAKLVFDTYANLHDRVSELYRQSNEAGNKPDET